MRFINPDVSLKKPSLNKLKLILSAAILFCFSFASAQPYTGAIWGGYNSSTQTFPFNGISKSPYFSSVTHNYKGLTTHNDPRLVWIIPNTSATLDIATAPYLSYTVVTNRSVTFDRFAYRGLAKSGNSKLQLRWSVDNFATSLGEFTSNGSSYTLTSATLGSLGSIPAGTIEFRVYCYAAASAAARIYIPSSSSVYASVDGTPAGYSYKNSSASIWFSASEVVLPVTLIDFNLRQQSRSINLAWKTSAESNSKLFSIERGKDGKSFSEIKQVDAKGKLQEVTNYVVTDDMPIQGYAFYRLKMVDKDGGFTYSDVQKIEYRTTELTGVKIYPVPARDYIIIENSDPDFIQSLIKITDAAGNNVSGTRVQSNVQKINLSSFAPGLYFVQLQNGNSYKIIKK